VPLATFAFTPWNQGDICNIMVQYLDMADQKAIVFGSMFFQSVWALMDWQSANEVEIYLQVNNNALNSTMIIIDPQPIAANPFKT
jgi:hypothetical protein